MSEVLLLEIGTEELPASFVASGVAALPGLIGEKLASARLSHGAITAAGTPRRLAVWVEDVPERQPDLDEEVTGPPVRVAFDKDGAPTRAAQSFADKIGVVVESLGRVETPKGEYIVGRKKEEGKATTEILAPALTEVCQKIPFRKSMRWSDGDTAFGRPVRWLVALLGAQTIGFEFAGYVGGRKSYGHRFLSPEAFEIGSAAGYVDALRERHVLVRMEERAGKMKERLVAAAKEAGGELIDDDFLVGENASLVEEPHVVVGGFEDAFLALPERVILDVAKGHQRYFGVRSADGNLMAKYLAVVNTALKPANIRLGNDRVMRARLADAKFFYDEDLKAPLDSRLDKLDAVVFHKRLGSIGDKVRRITRLVDALGKQLSLSTETIRVATQGAALAKCDLTTLMVGELPELQGEMGHAYALKQGTAGEVARVIAEHYQPKGADDPTAESDAGALVGLADRLDTLTGCFAVGIMPTGTADPLALRRAAIGSLRTTLDKGWGLSVKAATAQAFEGFSGIKLEHSAEATQSKLLPFLEQRLRGVLMERLPQDAVDACLASSADVPHDVALRASALGALDAEVRASAGEVFKRAANIAKNAPEGEPRPPQEVDKDVHPSEAAAYDALGKLDAEVTAARETGDYGVIVHAIAQFAPTLGKYFDDVMVMADDAAVRDNRLRFMAKVQRICTSVANFNLLAR